MVQIPIARGPRPLRYQRRHLLKTYAFTELGGIIRTSRSDPRPSSCFGDALRWSVLPVPLHILNFSDASIRLPVPVLAEDAIAGVRRVVFTICA